jgi:hypothetical protein
MKTLDLVYFNAGGGHRAAAQALATMVRQQGLPWCVRLVNLFEVLDPKQRFERLIGMPPEAYYNKRLAKGWTIGLAQELKVLQATIRLAHPTLVRRLQQHWSRSEPDLVVSLVPNFNRSMQEALASVLPGVPYVTVLTDLADFPPRFWMEPRGGHDLVCGTQQAVQQALALGHPSERVHRVSGMILRPDFYAEPAADRAEMRAALGLDPTAVTGLVMFGGHGSSAMKLIARQLADLPLILMCGHNRDLADDLRALPAQAPRVVLEHTPNVAQIMRLADFFVGKPGPGSLSEALHCGLPVITCRNAFTLPQERFNTDWVRDQGVGIVVTAFAEIREAVAEMRLRRPELMLNLGRLHNRAVFEVIDILEHLLQRAAGPIDWRRAPTRDASAELVDVTL